MDANDIIEDMKIATGWHDISFVNDTIVLRCKLSEKSVIKGLRQNSECFFLEFEDYADIPLSFLITQGDVAHQYWTLRERLHRGNDLPAYVSYDPEGDRIIRKWYWNGLKHRTTGPAREVLKGFKVNELQGFSDFYQETWELLHLDWFIEGLPSGFPYCADAKMEGGQRIRSKATNKIQSPRDDLPALIVDECTMNWDTFKPNSEFRPVSASISELREIYDREGKITNRECSRCDFTWRRGSDIFKAEDHTAFNELFKDELISMVDLWGPFYKTDSTEFIVITEFDRMKS